MGSGFVVWCVLYSRLGNWTWQPAGAGAGAGAFVLTSERIERVIAWA